jgi:antitoxin HicB
MFTYPARFRRGSDGRYLVTFRDLPEALTDGGDETEALIQAQDCLIAALGGYIEARRPIPMPTKPRRGERLIALPPLVAAKLALNAALVEQGLSQTALGRRLAISETAVRRLLDLDHRSHIGQVEAALRALGKRLVVEVHDAA